MIQTLLLTATLAAYSATAPQPNLFDASATLRAAAPARPELQARLPRATPPMGKLRPASAEPPKEIGQFEPFWIVDFTRMVATDEIILNEDKFQIWAELVTITDHAYLYVEEWLMLDPALLDQLILDFENNIYATVADRFGPAPDALDGDPRITILVSTFYGTDMFGATAAGYFDEANQYTDTEAWHMELGHSNEREMIYINQAFITPDIWTGGLSEQAFGLFAHEYQHLTHWGLDPDESVWFNEACSEYAMIVCGYENSASDHMYSFAQNPTSSLTLFSNTLEQYGTVLYFIRYLAERFGGADTIRSLAQDPGNSVEAVDAYLKETHNLSFRQVYHDWLFAMMLDETEDGPYRYTGEDKPTTLRRLLDQIGFSTFFTATFDGLNGSAFETMLYEWAPDYYILRRSGAEDNQDFYGRFQILSPLPASLDVQLLTLDSRPDEFGMPMYSLDSEAKVQFDADGVGEIQLPAHEDLFGLVISNTTPDWQDDGATTLTYRFEITSGTATVRTDDTPPAAITDLAIESADNDHCVLTWTASGDDGLVGMAAEYDLRFSTQTLTADNFTSGRRAPNLSHPAPVGSAEQCVLTGLPPNATVYCLLRVTDDAGGVAWSNVVTVQTGSADTIPPAPLTGFRVVSRSILGLEIGWTAPGDDGDTGRATQYDVRWSNRPITDELSFRHAYIADRQSSPSPAGQMDTAFFGGVQGIHLYIAVRALDEAGNASPISHYEYIPEAFNPRMLWVY